MRRLECSCEARVVYINGFIKSIRLRVCAIASTGAPALLHQAVHVHVCCVTLLAWNLNYSKDP